MLFSLEGNIGSGKSTILKKLKESCPSWFFVDEPVGVWLDLKNGKGESLLELFYNNKERWSYTFQNVAVLHRFKNLKKALDDISKSSADSAEPIVIVMERCLLTDKMVFTKMLRHQGCIDDMEIQIYEQWFEHLAPMIPAVNVYIYIDTPPEVCLERIASRAREGESVIPLDYLKQLDHYHHEWLSGNDQKCPVLSFRNIDETIKLDAIQLFVRDLLMH